VLLAWWLTHRVSQRNQEGEAVINEIHQGLSKYWGGPAVQYFLLQSKGQTRGYRIEARQPNDGEGLRGLSLIVTAGNSPQFDYEQWLLNESATQAEYQSGPAEQPKLPNTSIELKKGRVDVLQSLEDGNVVRSRNTAPGNYIPEGCLPLVIRLVAENKTHANFKMIVNSIPPEVAEDGRFKTRFIPVEMKYKGSQSIMSGATAIDAAVVLLTVGSEEQTFYLGSTGELLMMTTADHEETAVSAAELVSKYPHALEAFAGLAKVKGMNLSVSQSRPSRQ
jgi:hypothetical protein